MTLWEVRDVKGQPTGRRILGPLRVAEQRLCPGQTLVLIDGRVLPRARPPGRAPRLLARAGSEEVLAKRQRLRERLEAGAASFTRAALLELIRSGALDRMEER